MKDARHTKVYMAPTIQSARPGKTIVLAIRMWLSPGKEGKFYLKIQKGIFYVDRNVLPSNMAECYTGTCNHQTHQCIHLSDLYIKLCENYLNKKMFASHLGLLNDPLMWTRLYYHQPHSHCSQQDSHIGVQSLDVLFWFHLELCYSPINLSSSLSGWFSSFCREC